MIPKLVILTEIIAPYRIPVFNALARRPEIDLQVIFLSENDPTRRQWRVYKDEISFTYEVLPSWRQRLGQYNVLINRGVHSALNRAQPDIVLCGGYNYLASWAVAHWARIHRVPLLLWSESTAFDLRRRYQVVEFMKMRFLKMCSGFVVPGASSLNYLKALGIEEQLIFTAPNAVDTSLFSNLAEGVRRDESLARSRHGLPPRYFLYVGRMVRAKGVFDLLDAYSQLEPDLRSKVGLVFVGDGTERRRLIERASKITHGTIQFPGFVHRDQLPEIYALADGLILPTYSDVWGLVANEAMACNLPVIVTSVAGCALDLVENEWNGFVVPPRDPSRLAASMENLAADSGRRQEMGCRSRQRIDGYSPAAWAEGMVDAVQSVRAGMR